MKFAEIVVNIPIRRTFGRRDEPSVPNVDYADEPVEPGEPSWRTFHYAVPSELRDTLRPGHLVWVPFGRQEVQGIVVDFSDYSPVPAKPIVRLARPQPILFAHQIALAKEIATHYVAPLSEALKLFVPPGLLKKEASQKGVRVKRELFITLEADESTIDERLPHLARDSAGVRVLSVLLDYMRERSGDRAAIADVRRAAHIKSDSALRTLAHKELLAFDSQHVWLVQSRAEAEQAWAALSGLDRLRAVLDVLRSLGGAAWKSDLYAALRAAGESPNPRLLDALQTESLVRSDERVRFRNPLADRLFQPTSPPPLTSDQQAAWACIEERLHAAERAAEEHGATAEQAKFLLHGVTGSGKTEIYLRAIARTLEQNRQAIVLVPEIALTPQTVARFAGRFPNRVTVIHSQLSAGERYDVWRAIRDGAFDVVVGPRSALFAPMERLGLVILDEEHESSYKQNAEEWGSFTVFYDARWAAEHLAHLTNSSLILGSATPSLESYHAAMQGKVTLLEMTRRVLGHVAAVESVADEPANGAAGASISVDAAAGGAPTLYAEMPPVEIVDMRQELRAGNRSIFSRSLSSEVHATLDAGEQAILFLNRRGTNTFILCRDCGYVCECPRCEIPLTYHERASQLLCHRCNQREPIPERCPECDSRRIKYFGSGTQRVEELVTQIAPRARVLRWDADTTGRRGSHEAILDRFASREADVLVGTQMIAKGLDLPMVTLVGVIAADVGLYLPDFRSGERTFQLLTQVAGRAGRSERGGRVVIQSYTPEHYAIRAAAQHDYLAFYRREIGFRSEHSYPPLRRLARLIYWDKRSDRAQEAATQMTARLRHRLDVLGVEGEQVGVLGPAPAFFARFRGYYRWQVLLRAPDPARVLHGVDIPFGWRIDVDPVSTL